MTARTALVLLALVACKKGDDPTGSGTTTPDGGVGGPEPVDTKLPLPEGLDTIDFTAAFTDAVQLLITVDTISPWAGHRASLDTRVAGCPDFWTGTYEEGGIEVASEDGVSWRDDCLADEASGLAYDGWIWWDSSVVEEGDPDSYEGRTSDATRTLDGDGVVSDADGVRYEFNGTATDNYYNVDANGYRRFVYSSNVDATVTGSDVFDPATSVTPRGYRTSLIQSLTGGDVDAYDADGDVYLFEPQIQGRFDSVGAQFHLQGPLGAAPDECTLEPFGWIGVRDPDAVWYDVIFQPVSADNITQDPYVIDELSACDGCGRLYVRGAGDAGMDVCIDLSFVFQPGAFPLPDADDYVLPFHSL